MLTMVNARKNSERYQGIKKSCDNEFVYKLISHSLVALTCSLLFCYPYWSPSLISSMKQIMVILSHPSSLSSFFTPKCLFIIVNVIVVFLLGESKLVGYSQSSPASEFYDEYVERTRRLRGASSTLQQQAELTKLERASIAQDEQVIDKQVMPELIKNEDTEVENEDKEVENEEEEVEEYKEIEEEDKEVEAYNYADGGDEKENDVGEEESHESGLPAEELNRRVEDFIARVNKQRRLEAKLLVCCEA